MNHRVTILGIILSCAVPHCVGGADQLTEEQIERLATQAPKVHLPDLIAFNEAKLERIYQAKLRAADPEYQEALKESQDAWRKFYEADRVVGALEVRGGSGQAVFAMERRVYQLRLRIYQLSKDYLQGWVAIPKVHEPAP